MPDARQPDPRQRAAAWRIAVIGAGPAGLALALQAAQRLPLAEVTLFDARPADKDVSGDPRTLALALGSVQWLRRLGAWPDAAAQPIREVLVSQAPPTLSLPWLPAEVTLEDGLRSIATGIAAHQSIATGLPVAMADVLPAGW